MSGRVEFEQEETHLFAISCFCSERRPLHVLLMRLRLRPPHGAEFNDVVLHPRLRQQVGGVGVDKGNGEIQYHTVSGIFTRNEGTCRCRYRLI